LNIADLTGLEYCTNLHYLYLYLNHISDISPIANLANLTVPYLQINQISDIGPLVQNEGLGTGDLVNVQVNPLSSDSIDIYIPQLQARGVTVYY
jgi:Leucine-rich repeat (LRR) protein